MLARCLVSRPGHLLIKFKADRQRQLDVLPLAFANQPRLDHLYRGFVEHPMRTAFDDDVAYLTVGAESEFGQYLTLNIVQCSFARIGN